MCGIRQGCMIMILCCFLAYPCENLLCAAEVLESTPSPHVQDLIAKYKLQLVDHAYVAKAIGNGTRGNARAILVDARPAAKYEKGTIPSSINIPDSAIQQYVGQLDGVSKEKEIIVFCGGWKCEKSPLVAGYLKEHGFSNVKLYQAGSPDWPGYKEVGVVVVQSAVEKDSAVLMDARPRKKYLAETLPGAVFMNDEELDRLAGRFPIDKKTPIIAFCGGYSCNKSHHLAARLLKDGYVNVRVFAAGMPAWKKAGLRTTAGASADRPVVPVEKKDVFVAGIKKGIDDGSVDGEWLLSLIKSNNVPENAALIDVRSADDFAAGHLLGSLNIEAGQLTAQDLAAQLPQGKVTIFLCGTGARAMEAFLKLQKGGLDVSKIMYFDANIICDKDNMCEFEINEPLG